MMTIRNAALALLLAFLSQLAPSAHAGLAVAGAAANTGGLDSDALLREAFLDELEADEGLQALSQEVSQRFQHKDMYILAGERGQPQGN
mmetsp:Transcript_31645/g.67196  ORF Transcript_31645/g.67196 Transcript_31645/m.67196 type:complete len:89 (-) Transcript_31645:86-352(-)